MMVNKMLSMRLVEQDESARSQVFRATAIWDRATACKIRHRRMVCMAHRCLTRANRKA